MEVGTLMSMCPLLETTEKGAFSKKRHRVILRMKRGLQKSSKTNKQNPKD